jgi:hypothetical protein
MEKKIKIPLIGQENIERKERSYVLSMEDITP